MPVPKRRTWKNFKTLLQRIRTVLQVSWRRCYNLSRTSCKLLDENVTTYHERLARYLSNLLHRIKNVFKVTWWRWYNTSGTSCELFDKNVTTYQERLANNLKNMLQRIKKIPKRYVKKYYYVSKRRIWKTVAKFQERLSSSLEKMLQCIKNVLQTTWRRCYNVSGLFSVLQVTWRICYNVSGGSSKNTWKKYYYVSKRRTWRNGLQRVRKVLQVACKRYYNVSQTSCKLLAGDVTTYQEHLASYLGTLLQRIRNVFTVTWWRCYDVSIASCKLLDENVTTYQELVTKFLLRIKETYLKKLLQRVRNDWQVAWRWCYNVSRTPCKLLDEDVATYRERLASHLRKLSQCDRNVFKKMSQRIKNVVQFTWQKCYNVSTPSCVLPVIWKICYNISKGSSKDTWQKIFYVSKTRTWKNCFNISETSC
jgi:alkylated DNA nucleotide flippase Atl1